MFFYRKITAILFFTFVTKTLCLNLQCTSSQLGTNHVSGTGCTASSLNVVTDNQVVKSVNNQNVNSFAGASYLILAITGQNTVYLPQEIGKFFINLKALKVTSSKLKYLRKKDLKFLTKVIEMDFSSNNLQSLPGNLFDENLEVQCMHFENNQITHIGSNFLKPLKKLNDGYFTGNLCIKLQFTDPTSLVTFKSALKACPEPPNDDTTKNESSRKTSCDSKFKSADENLDAATRQLLILMSRSGNFEPMLTNVEIEILCKITGKTCEVDNLKVETRESEIKSVQDEKGVEIDMNSTDIEVVNIFEQQSLFFPLNFGIKFPKLKQLTIIYSGLFFIDDKTFDNMTLLTSLKLNENKIRKIPANAFNENKMMKSLDLSMNKIETIDDDAFSGQENLIDLNLEQNLVFKVNSEIFKKLSKLEILNLRHNQIRKIESKIFYGLPQLLMLDISRE